MSRRPSLSKSPTARPRLTALGSNPGPAASVTSRKARRSPSAHVLEERVPLGVRADDLRMPVDLRVDVAVGDDEVEVPVVVEIGEGRSPLQRAIGRGADAAGPRNVLEDAVAQAAVERGEILGEVGGEEVEDAVAVDVADGEPHAGLGGPVGVEGAPLPRGDLREDALPLVAIEVVRVGVVGDVEVDAAVAVVVGGAHARSRSPGPCPPCRGRRRVDEALPVDGTEEVVAALPSGRTARRRRSRGRAS